MKRRRPKTVSGHTDMAKGTDGVTDKAASRQKSKANLILWRPGQSGNRQGMPAHFAEYRQQVRGCTWEALCVLYDALKSSDEAIAVKAACELLDRGWGKGPIPITGLDGEAIKVDIDSDRLIQMVRRLAGELE